MYQVFKVRREGKGEGAVFVGMAVEWREESEGSNR